MRTLFVFLLAVFALPAWAGDCPQTLDFNFRKLAAKETDSLCEQYAGKVVLVVNTASFCGYTPQYQGLEALYKKYQDKGLVVLGFPSNDFSQEPGDEDAIKEFCDLTYSVKFPMYEKLKVREGSDVHPFYRNLAVRTGSYPRWNFHKYLIDRSGEKIISFPTRVSPDDPQLVTAIESLL
jgi:glutathione peroxidase